MYVWIISNWWITVAVRERTIKNEKRSNENVENFLNKMQKSILIELLRCGHASVGEVVSVWPSHLFHRQLNGGQSAEYSSLYFTYSFALIILIHWPTLFATQSPSMYRYQISNKRWTANSTSNPPNQSMYPSICSCSCPGPAIIELSTASFGPLRISLRFWRAHTVICAITELVKSCDSQGFKQGRIHDQ